MDVGMPYLIVYHPKSLNVRISKNENPNNKLYFDFQNVWVSCDRRVWIGVLNEKGINC